ncbi:MAG: diguanylate cyclase [Oceanidesulfovibrio sp.]
MRILIIDDSEGSRLILTTILRSAGHYDIIEAANASEAYDILACHDMEAEGADVDIILMDLHLPGEDGIAATRIIRSATHLSDIPILIVTADDKTAALEQAFRAGATDFLRKPVEPVELRTRVRSCLCLKEETENRKARERELMEMAGRLRKANHRLKELSIRDELTGIYNRRHFMEVSALELSRAIRYERPIALLFLDADHFKKINDNHGHFVGDRALCVLAEACRKQLRDVDIFGRIGGEEFAVLLPETSEQEAMVVANRLRKSIADATFTIADPRNETAGNDDSHRKTYSVRFTISIGVAISEADHISLEEFMHRADQALYRAKDLGRNRVELG